MSSPHTTIPLSKEAILERAAEEGKLSLFESCVQKHHVATLNTGSCHF